MLKGLKELLKKKTEQADFTDEQFQEELNKLLAEEWVPKGTFNETNEAKKLAEGQLKDANTQLDNLKKNASLTDEQKKELDDLKAKMDEQETTYKKELQETKRGYALEQALTGAKARDVKSVLPHIDQSKLAWSDDNSLAGGLKEQLEALQKDKSFLFEESGGDQTQGKPRFGGSPGEQPKAGEAAIQARFAEKLGVKPQA